MVLVKIGRLQDRCLKSVFIDFDDNIMKFRSKITLYPYIYEIDKQTKVV